MNTPSHGAGFVDDGSVGEGSGLIGRLFEAARGALARGPAEPETAPAVLIVTSRHRLWQRHGPEGVFAIERSVGRLCEAMARRGLSGTPVYVEGSPLLTALGVLPAEAGRAEDVGRLIREIAGRLAWTDEAARHVLLLGDHEVIPFHRLPNPSDDDDDAVWSDHPYGADPESLGGMARGVGRIPDRDLAMLVDGIDAAAAAHRRLADGEPPAMAPESFGYSASIWKRAARGAYAALGAPNGLRLSPPLSHRDVPHPGPDGPRFRYFNLHGLIDSPDWFGQVDPTFPADYAPFPVALRLDEVAAAPGSVVFSEACHGARLMDRSRDDSIALAHLAGGSLAFVGSTGVAYGGIDGTLVAADLLAFHFWRALRSGASAGHALTRAKALLVRDAMARQGYLDAEDEKTVAGFVLYGDPSLPHVAPQERKAMADRAAVSASGVAARPVSMGPRRMEEPAPMRDAAEVACSIPKRVEGDRRPSMARISPSGDGPLVEAARRKVARQLPGFDGDDVAVHVSRSSARRTVIAKDLIGDGGNLGDVGGAARGASSGGGRVVVTLARSIPTCAGPMCRTVVQVTMDPRSGEVRKMSVSR